MTGLYEALFLFFSGAEMMLMIVSKALIVQTIQDQAAAIPPAGVIARAEGDSMLTEGSSPEGAGARLNDKTQARISLYLMLDLVCVFTPWVVLGPLCGMWSDRNGRKVPLMLPSVAHVLAVLAYLVTPFAPGHLLVIVLASGLSRGTCGNHAMFTTALYSLLSDILPPGERSTRFALLTACRYLGVCLGTLLAGFMQDSLGIPYTLLTAAAVQAVCFLVIVVFVKDTAHLVDRCHENKGSKEETNAVSDNNNKKRNWPLLKAVRRLRTKFRCRYCSSLDECEETSLVAASANGTRPEDKEDDDRSDKGLCPCLFHGDGLRTVPAVKRRVIVAALMLTFLTQSLWSSQREVIVQSVTLHPFDWPGSWFGYLYSAYYGSGGVGLMLLAPALDRLCPASMDRDVAMIVLSILCGAVSSVWLGVATGVGSDWQAFVSVHIETVLLDKLKCCHTGITPQHKL